MRSILYLTKSDQFVLTLDSSIFPVPHHELRKLEIHSIPLLLSYYSKQTEHQGSDKKPTLWSPPPVANLSPPG